MTKNTFIFIEMEVELPSLNATVRFKKDGRCEVQEHFDFNPEGSMEYKEQKKQIKKAIEQLRRRYFLSKQLY